LAAEGPVRLGELTVPLAPKALPIVLSGGLPVTLPAGTAGPAPQARDIEFDDPTGGHWRVTLAADGGLASWRLAGADGASLAWERRGERQLLVATSPPFAIEWRESARERLTQPEPAWSEPAGSIPECGGFGEQE
jgi:hypothetical protein